MVKKNKRLLLVYLLILLLAALPLAACGDSTATTSPATTVATTTVASTTTAAATTAAATTTAATTVASATTAAATTTAVATTTAAAKTGIKPGGSFIFGLTTEPDHLDPYQATSADTREVLFNLFEGLVKPDGDGNLQPAVAGSLPTISTDALTYTFKVRSGIKFHNGNAVTADDVKYSLDTAAGLKIAGLDNIQTVEVVDPTTVKISLKKADTDFLPYLTVAIVPKDYKDQNTHPIGTGPFAFDSFTPQQALVLKKNTSYWQKDLPYLDKVTFKLKSDTNALLLDLQSGSVDGAIVDSNTSKQLGSNFSINQANSNAVQQLNFNNAVKPFDNQKVRLALSYVVDPDEIISTVNFGKGTRVGTPVIPGLKAYFDASLTDAYKKNIDKAKQLLSEAGYTNGFSFTITVPSNYQVHVDTAQVIVNQLKTVGVTAQIKQVDFPTWISKVYTDRQYEATIISVDGANLSPQSFLARYVSTASGNFFNYKSADYDTLYAKAVAESAQSNRIELFKQLQQLVSKDAPNVFIQDIATFTALKNGLSGFTPYPLYVFDASTIYYKG
ncbi:MAG: ABC transporter substrate-binding protein [Chloroflexi bacterium]|uniref:ABC transporter substrate-binding protein n=1 Tax=Candidatus Chlorohelix allophototropha TaxID=3003348 RepID=A0A8T7M466_9CHLR|nr:ABC transporter substrate-binding protein [Chloroflexota bacterium]WJW70140.1 ABC transporter substrate-binding protein [Chloroflexota bacterium L227-S17]